MANDNRPQIVLDGNITPLQQKLREAGSLFAKFGSEADKSLSGLGSVAASAAGRIAALGSAIAGLGLGVATKSVIDQADALDEMSERTGLAVESLASLKFAGKQTGVELGQIGDAVKKLGKLMVDAASGNEDANRTLKAFGITGQQIAASDVDGALRNIANAVAELPKEARQGALENLARGFGDLVPMLQNGADGLDRMRQKAEQLGVVDGIRKSASGAAEFNDSLDRLNDTMIGIGQRAIGGLLPDLAAMTDRFGQTLLSVEKNRESLETLGAVAIGGVLTNALRGLTVSLSASISGWWASVQAARQAASAKIAAATAAAGSAQAIKAHTAMLVAEAEAAVASAAGMARLSLVQNTLIPARQQLVAATQNAVVAERALAVAKAETSAKTSMAGIALATLGGPLGAIVTLIGLGVTAWAAFGREGVSAVSKVSQEIERGREVLARYHREKKYGAGDEGQVRSSLEAVESQIAILVQSSGRSEAAAAKLAILRKEAEALQSVLDEMESSKQKGGADPANAALQRLQSALAKPEDKKDKAAEDPSFMAVYEARLAEIKNAYEQENVLRQYSKEQELEYWRELQQNYQLTNKDRLTIAKRTATLELEIRRQSAKEQRDLDSTLIDSRRAAALAQIQLAEQQAGFARENEAITQRELISMQEGFARRRFEIEYQSLLERLELAKLDPNTSPAELARIKEQLLEVERSYLLRRGELQQAVVVEGRALWNSFTDTVSSLWDKGINAMMQGTLTWRNAWRAVLTDMTGWFATEVVGKQVKQWISGQAQLLAAKLGFMKADEAASLASSARLVANKATETTAAVAGDAAQAGAGAAKSQAGIPIVGPWMALAAMATVFAAVMALSKRKSAAGGFDIPKGLNPLTQLHEEEMVLPKQYANVIRGLAGGGEGQGGAGSGGMVFSPTIKAMDSRDVIRALKEGGALHKALKEMERSFVR